MICVKCILDKSFRIESSLTLEVSQLTPAYLVLILVPYNGHMARLDDGGVGASINLRGCFSDHKLCRQHTWNSEIRNV